MEGLNLYSTARFFSFSFSFLKCNKPHIWSFKQLPEPLVSRRLEGLQKTGGYHGFCQGCFEGWCYDVAHWSGSWWSILSFLCFDTPKKILAVAKGTTLRLARMQTSVNGCMWAAKLYFGRQMNLWNLWTQILSVAAVAQRMVLGGSSQLVRLVTSIYKPFGPFIRRITPFRGLTNHGC